MLGLLTMPIWQILLLLFVLVVAFNVVAKLFVNFILKLFGKK